MRAFVGQSSSEMGAAAPLAEGLLAADAGGPGEAWVGALGVALAEDAHPGVPSPMPLPRLASLHCWAAVRGCKE